MRLEYFQMIDRYRRRRYRRARDPRDLAPCRKHESTVFEGHFPGYPLMPGVLLIECMAQTTGWLVSALTGFTGMPILAGVKEAKIRTPCFPATHSNSKAKSCTKARASPSAKPRAGARAKSSATPDHLSPHPLSKPGIRQAMWDWAERINFPSRSSVK
jgi:3-hydroxyacyl-[acyl-carrier-protein] dehydratase